MHDRIKRLAAKKRCDASKKCRFSDIPAKAAWYANYRTARFQRHYFGNVVPRIED